MPISTRALKDSSPDDVDLLVNYRRVLDDKGEHHGAIASYSEILVLKPDHAIALNGRAWASAQKGDLDKALADAERAVALNAERAERDTHARLDLHE